MQQPKKICQRPGCGQLTDHVYCASHESDRPRRATARERGYSNRWDSYSRAYLRHHPFCADPFQRHQIPVLATHVDHIIPHKGDMQLFWDRTNHRGLCTGCHSSKTATFDGGFGNQIKNAERGTT